MDADEFAADDLRDVVATAHRERADHVRFSMAQFHITRREADEGRVTAADRHLPIQTRRRAYVMDQSWRRLFRNLPWLRWNDDTSWPQWLVRWGSRRLEIRHYQFRDLEQVKLRIETRAQLALTPEFLRMHPHWSCPRVEDFLVDETDPRVRWANPGEALVPDAAMPPVQIARWRDGLFEYARAMAHARIPQRAAELLHEVDVDAVLHRMRPMPNDP